MSTQLYSLVISLFASTLIYVIGNRFLKTNHRHRKFRFATAILIVGFIFLFPVPKIQAQTTPAGAQTVPISIGDGNTYYGYLYLPNDYNSTTTKYPLLVFMHGAGEGACAGGLPAIYNSTGAGGPPYFIEHGQWPASFTNPANGQSYKFIVFAPQHPCQWSFNGAQLNTILTSLVPNYRVDTSRVYVTGLSAGGVSNVEYTTHVGWASTATYPAAAFVPMSPAMSQPDSSISTPLINENIRAWTFGSDPADIHGVRAHQLADLLNSIVPGFARYTNYSGGHCCWNQFYNPTYKETINGVSMNIYEWLLQFTRGGSNSVPTNNAPTVNAGADQTVTLPTSSATLSGSASDSDGSISSYSWSQQFGPNTATISSASSASTNISGLIAGSYRFRLTVTDNGGATAYDDINVSVNAATGTQSPYGGTARAIPGTIQAEDYDLGGEGVSYHDYTATNQGSQYRTSEAVDVGTDDGGYAVGWTTDGEWIEYTVNVATSGTYTLQLRSSTVNTGKTLKIDMDGTALSTITIPNTGAWGTYQTTAGTNVSLTAGTHTMKLTFNTGSVSDPNAGFNVNYIKFTSTAANVAPTVNAGVDQTITLPTSSLTLTGSTSDSDGSVASYAWTKTAGGTATIASPSSASTVISGLAQGTYTFRLTATDNAGATAYDDVNVLVNAAPTTTQSPYGGSARAIPGTIQTEDFDNGGEGVAYHDTTTTNDGASYRTGEAVDTETTSDTGGGYNVGYIADGEWMEYSVNVQTSGIYTIEARVTSPNTGKTLRVDMDATNLGTITVPNTGGWQTWQSVTLSNIALSSGTHTLKLTMNTGSSNVNSGFNLNYVKFTSGTQTTNAAPTANAGADKSITLPTTSVTLSGSGSDSDGTVASYAWSKVSGGVATIASPTSASTAISGLTQGTYTFRLTVTDNGGATGFDDVNVTVNGSGVCSSNRLYVTKGSDGSVFGLPAAQPGDTIVLRASQNPYSWMYFSNLHGTADCPIIITNEGGQVLFTAGISFTNSSHFKILGNGSTSDQYGIKIEDPAGTAFAVHGTQLLDDVELAYIYINHTKYGFQIKQEALADDGGCDPALQYPNTTITNFSIHDNKITNTESQGFYLGTTAPNGGRGTTCNGVYTDTIRPARLGGFKIFNNIVTNSGRSGIQLSSASGDMSEIYNNTVRNSGMQNDDQQGSNIVIGGYTKVYVHDNDVANTLVANIASIGGTYVRIENNKISNDANLGSVHLPWPWNIWIDTRDTIPTENTQFIVKNNTITNTYQSGGANDILVGLTKNTFASSGNVICGNTTNGDVSAVSVPWSVTWSNNCGTNAVPVVHMTPNDNSGGDFNIAFPRTDTWAVTPTVTDADGTVVSYQWVQIGGPKQAVITNPTSLSTTFSDLTAPGFYDFQLRATDNKGAVGVAGIVIGQTQGTVNLPPKVTIGQDLTYPWFGTPYTISQVYSSTALSPSVVDTGDTDTYQWTKISGPAATITSPNTITTDFTGLTQGTYIFRLTATDSLGQTGYDDMTITIGSNVANTPPQANAGIDKVVVLPASTTTLTASGTDVDGSIASYYWTKTFGGTATIASPTSATTNITGLTAGTYLFEVRVRDDKGADSTDTVAVVVTGTPIGGSPIVNAGVDQAITLPTNSVTLTGSATDTDGTIASYAWTKVSGGVATIASPSNASTVINGLAEGTYIFRLTATDNSGTTGSDDVIVVVAPKPNTAPAVNAGVDQTITLPTSSVSFTGTAVDVDGDAMTYAWTKTAGGTATIASPSALSTVVSGLAQGTYTFTLTATDSRGASGTDTVTVLVNGAANVAPTANAGLDKTIKSPTSSVTLTGTGTDVDGTITSYAWTKMSGTGGTIASPSSASTNVTNLTVGTYVYRLTVTDNLGAVGTDDVTVTVQAAKTNKNPHVKAATTSPITTTSTTLMLAGAATDEDGTIASTEWTQASGPQASIASPTSLETNITGLDSGTYEFTLAATDNDGGIATDTVRVVVSKPASSGGGGGSSGGGGGGGSSGGGSSRSDERPTVSAGGDQTITLPNSTVVLNGTGSDKEGSVTYEWKQVSGHAGAKIDSSRNAKATVTGLTEGRYVFGLTVTDKKGQESNDQAVVTVLKAATINIPSSGGNGGNRVKVNVQTSLRVRSDASITSAPIGSVAGGLGGTVVQQKTGPTGIEWLQVQFDNGTTGWVSKAYTVADQTTPTVPTTPSTPNTSNRATITARLLNVRASAGGPVIGQVTSGNGGAVLSDTGSWLQVQFDNGTTGWVSKAYTTSTAASPQPITNTVTVNATTLNVRSAPSGAVIGKVTLGTTGTVLSRSGAWIQVQFPMITGYVSGAYIR